MHTWGAYIFIDTCLCRGRSSQLDTPSEQQAYDFFTHNFGPEDRDEGGERTEEEERAADDVEGGTEEPTEKVGNREEG